MDILDAVILLLVASALVSGYRRGISWVGPSLVGLIVGVVAGAAAAPPVAAFFSKQPNVEPLITSGVFLGIVLIVQGIGTTIGFRARVRSLRTRFAAFDSALGSLLAVAGVLAGSWYLGLTFSQSPWTALDTQINGSAIEKALDGAAPRPPGFLASLENSLRNSSFPNPFSGIAPIAPPPAAIPPLVDTPGIRALEVLGAEEGVEAAFDDVADIAAACRFSDCRHEGEPGCAIRAALDSADEGAAPAAGVRGRGRPRRACHHGARPPGRPRRA